jgi:hypothetical protein
MKIEKKHFNEIMKANAGQLVGKACARIEEIYAVKPDLSDKQKFELIKSALRNLIPESFRDAGFQLDCYSKGKEVHKIDFNKNPTDSE